jgi:putative ABC transport system permease protein
VQGVFAERKSAMGGNFDNYVLMPISVWKRMYGARDEDGRPRGIFITVRATSMEVLEDAKEETRAVLRASRGLGPRDEDNFFFRSSDGDIRLFNEATANLKTAAFVLGIIALIVAGIGIMNIMLVSVTERTREIGIRKALGAKRRTILLQFLMEAIVLCNIGGLLGVAAGFGLGNLVTVFFDFAVHIPMEWAVRGLLFCTVVGVVFGMWPALRASRLIPVEALRYE